MVSRRLRVYKARPAARVALKSADRGETLSWLGKVLSSKSLGLFLLFGCVASISCSSDENGTAQSSDAGTAARGSTVASGGHIGTGGSGGSAGSSSGGTPGAGGRTNVGGGGAGGGNAGASGGSGGSSGDGGSSPDGATGSGSGRWVLGYWAVWQATTYPLDHVDWSAMTHVALSFVLARAPATPTANSPYATLDTDNVFANLGSSGMTDFSAAAHAGGVKALISLGGGGAGVGFAAAAGDANRAAFIADVLAACSRWNFDGVDLDWEDSIDFPSFRSLVDELRAAAPPGFLITVPVGSVNDNLGIDSGTAGLWSAAYGEVDQLNVMTYTGSGAYPGWVVWYLSPLFGQGPDHPFDVASTMDAWRALGIPKSKLGLGIGFYGRSVGPPVTAALQSYGNAEVYGNDSTLSYGSILRNFYGKGGAAYHWDDTAKAPYLTWPTPFQPSWANQFPGEPPPTVQFLTYEDPAGVAAKGDFAKANGYGGAIIWTINEGIQFPDGSDGYANPLLDAVKRAFR
jgi:chitinase